MTKTTNKPVIKFDIEGAVKVASEYAKTTDQADNAAKQFESAKAKRETLVRMFADVNRACGFRKFDHLQAAYKDRKEGANRQEFLDALAASYLKPAELATYNDHSGLNAVLASRDGKKQITSPRGEVTKKITAFVSRLLSAAEPFVSETVAAKKKRERAEAKPAIATKKTIRTLEQVTVDCIAAILKKIINDAKQTEPTATCHKELQTYMKGVQKHVLTFFK